LKEQNVVSIVPFIIYIHFYGKHPQRQHWLISMKQAINTESRKPCYIQRIKHKKVKFGVRYDVSSIKKRILELDTMYQAPNEDFSYFCAARKGQKENFRASDLSAVFWPGTMRLLPMRC